MNWEILPMYTIKELYGVLLFSISEVQCLIGNKCFFIYQDMVAVCK